MRRLVIIPTYNEKENVAAMIAKVFSLPEEFDLLIIDAGRPASSSASRISPGGCTWWSAAASWGWARPT